MNFEGLYKASRVVRMVEDQGFVFTDLEELLAQTEDIDDRRMYEQTARSYLMIDGDCNVMQVMAIPENTPAAEIETAKKRGMNVTADGKYLVLQTVPGKIEDGELYMYDSTKFLAGTDWVKISTENEDELALVTTIYKKI